MSSEGEAWAIVVAGGTGSRMGAGLPKQYLPLRGRPILARTLELFEQAPSVDGIVLVAEDDAEGGRARGLAAAFSKVRAVVRGGARRQDSVAAGLAALDPARADIVLIHDGVRPLLTPKLIGRCVEEARMHGSAVPVTAIRETVRRVFPGRRPRTVDRTGLYGVQTPQVFRASLLRKAMKLVQDQGLEVTDEAQAAEIAGQKVHTVAGERENLKITDREDLRLAEAILAAREAPGGDAAGAGARSGLRFGIGWDVHAFAPDRPLVLGGVTIPWPVGLAGHSDADVLVHAVCDAILGAAALGDIGWHFPDTDERFRGISSLSLLNEVSRLAGEAGFRVDSCDAVVIAEEPKLRPYIPRMREAIARELGIGPDRVSVKATTSEGLGFTGRKEGIACQAAAVLVRNGISGG